MPVRELSSTASCAAQLSNRHFVAGAALSTSLMLSLRWKLRMLLLLQKRNAKVGDFLKALKWKLFIYKPF